MPANRSLQLVLAFVTALSWSASANAETQPLVNVSWLKQHLSDKNLVIIDVYYGDQRAEFASRHIPGALFTNFSHGWRAKIGAAPGMLPPINDAEKLIGGLGIDNKSHVVLVPGGRETVAFNGAARIYWTLKVLGHDNVSILDGGDKAWFADTTNPVATGPTTAKPKKFVAHFRRNLLATRDDVKRAIRKHDAARIDTRTPAQFEGKAKSSAVRVAGTLPGAGSLPVEYLLTADGTRLADDATINAALAKAGVKTTGKQILFCNTAHLASGPWFLLHEIRGNKQATLYAGSMSDWTSDPKLPVANASPR